jgi:hypothetical protein
MKFIKYAITLFLFTLLCQFDVGLCISTASISDVKVKDMCVAAHKLYWQYKNSGLIETDTFEQCFTEDDVGYYYIGTKEEFIAYFMKVFTGKSALQFLQQELKQGFLKEHEGKLFHPDVGGGTIYNVSMGKVKLINAKGLIREYLIKAPGLEANDWYEEKVVFRFEEKIGWKIDSSPEVLEF